LEKLLKHEKTIGKSRHGKILSLQTKVVHIAIDPKDSVVVKSILDDKDREIDALNKKLNMPEIEPV